MKQTEKTQISIVEDVVFELDQIAALCNVMKDIDWKLESNTRSASLIMFHIWRELTTQIKALNGIQRRSLRVMTS